MPERAAVRSVSNSRRAWRAAAPGIVGDDHPGAQPPERAARRMVREQAAADGHELGRVRREVHEAVGGLEDQAARVAFVTGE